MSEKITIGIHSASWTEHSRRVLQGLLNYIEEYPNIQVRDFRFSSNDPNLVGNPPWAGKVDGAIVSAGRNPGITTWLKRGKVPVVLASGDLIDSGFVSVFTDVHSVGRLAATHLTEAGFEHIAFVGYQKSDGSKRRRDGLADELTKRGIKLKAVALKEIPVDTVEEDNEISESTVEKIQQLLEKSPKPLAVVALNDVVAEFVAKIALDMGLSIPDEVGVLGVGDSERARMTDPPLSSVHTPGVEIGYRCASLLHSMILGNTPKETVFEIPAEQVSARRSTTGWKRAAVTDIDRAVNYIREHACDGIRLKDVSSFVRIPIRTLEIEFKKQIGRSMGEVIREVRLERVKHLLESTNLSTQRIAAMVGYSHYSYLNKLLRDELNVTPSQYRKQQRNSKSEDQEPAWSFPLRECLPATNFQNCGNHPRNVPLTGKTSGSARRHSLFLRTDLIRGGTDMAAWTVKNAWTASTIQSYRNYASTNGPRRAGNLRSTCEDLSIRMVVDFAEQNGLPVFFCNNANPQGYDPARYSSKSAYLDAVLPTTGASDLLTYSTVVTVKGAQTGKADVSLPLAKPGDLIILYPGGGHVQVVTSVSPGTVNIVQGNFRPSSERCNVVTRKVFGNDQNDPSSSCYIGAIVAQKSYVRTGTPPKWIFGGHRDEFAQDGRLCLWDFDNWNHFVPNYNPAQATAP